MVSYLLFTDFLIYEEKKRKKKHYMDLRFGCDIHILSWAKVSSIKRSPFMKRKQKINYKVCLPRNNFTKHKQYLGRLQIIGFQKW